MTRLMGACVAAIVAGGFAVASAAAAAGPADVYQAIRANDLGRLKTLVASPEAANARGDFGQTPLMTAAVAGSVEAMTLLVDAGADVNAQNPFGTTALMMSVTELPKVRLLLARGADVSAVSKQGRTALFLAAMSDRSADVVRALVAKGADMKARDAFGNNLLNAAATGNDLATLRLALDAGLDVNGAAPNGATPLVLATYHNNIEAVKLLLARGARVNVAAGPAIVPVEDPKSGPIALSNVTPLLQASAIGSVDLVRTLLDAGADIHATDGRGLTALMLAVARTHQNPDVIRLLLDRGVDAAAHSAAGETAQDWARKTGVPAALELLHVQRPSTATAVPVARTTGDPRAAAERGIALLETSSQKFFEGSNCVSCHHQNATDLAVGEARTKGLRVDPAAAAARGRMLAAGPPPPLLLERMIIDVPEILGASMSAMAAAGVPANPVTDIIAATIAAMQSSDGSWHLLSGIGHRPPTADGEISRTAMAIRALKVYGPSARADMRGRIDAAERWLAAAVPATSEERTMQLLGLYWGGADAATLKRMAAPLAAMQQADGGWKQHDGLASDAYATGQSLYVLAKVGALAPAGAAYQKGVQYLLATQADTGAWRVASRAPKFQAYFNSGFPYGGDQWISAWATSWAAMALVQAVPEPAKAVAQPQR